LMDILPMHVVFSFLTPAAFWTAQRRGWKTTLLVSAFTWLIAQTHARDMLTTAFGDLPFIQLGPFDLFAWQFLWVSGLFIGQRLHEDETLPLPRSLHLLLMFSALAFLVWRWSSIAFGFESVTETWLLDKWHLGPLRLLNFFVAASFVAKFIKHLNRWETALQPLSLIGRHMLPIFCSQICLTLLLIGRFDARSNHEPVTSVLVLCQLLSAPLLACFMEYRWPLTHRVKGTLYKTSMRNNSRQWWPADSNVPLTLNRR
jgi:hypothetical protein